MFPSVQSTFLAFSTKFEGCIPYMYLDILGLVTVAVGNLVDPVELAEALPFRFKANPGTPATPAQIAAEWQTLKGNPDLARQGHLACAPLTQLELGDDSIDALILKQLSGNEGFLKRQTPFLNFDTWPADAQLGLLSMAWAMGPAGPGGFPHFSAACKNSDFNGAAAECGMNATNNAGLVSRNQANFTLFSNAALVLSGEAAGTFDRANLYWPRVLPAA
jgi:GH24 family phage-related lysozyme (muramidase)